MTRTRACAATVALIFVLAAALAGCGGDGGGGEDPSEVLEQTFNNPEGITSGQVEIGLDGSAEGAQAGDLTATIEGPFETVEGNPSAFPQLDLNVTASLSGAGQSFDFEGGLVATEDNAFVEYQGQGYEVGTSFFQRFKRAYERSVRQSQAKQGNQGASSIFERLGIDPNTWLTNLSNEGDEDVEGTQTVHIRGDADIEQIASDLARIAERAPGGAGQAFDPAQFDQVKSAIQEASLDVYSGKDDHILRRLSLSLSIVPPEDAGGAQVSNVNVDLSVTLSDVNQAQEIAAPSNARPIAGLLEQFGINFPGALGSPDASGGGGAGRGGGPSEAYLKCIDNNPADPGQCVSKLY